MDYRVLIGDEAIAVRLIVTIVIDIFVIDWKLLSIEGINFKKSLLFDRKGCVVKV